jgi:uncharacterized protein YwqG
VLSFFLDHLGALALMGRPEKREAFRVFWFEDDRTLIRHTPPPNTADRYASGRVRPQVVPSVPPLGSVGPSLPDYGDVPEDEVDALWRLRLDVQKQAGDEIGHQLLGWADWIQHPVEEEVVQEVHGCGDGDDFDHELWERVAHEVAQWRLLLQVGDDWNLDMGWGDPGTIYFMIERDALTKREFDRVWFNFQC